MDAPLLIDAFPDLAQELETLLAQDDEPELAAQIRQVRVIGRCRCGDNCCATFYTAPRPSGSYGPGHRNISLDCQRGMLILDVVHDKLMCIEVLDRDEIREKLHAIFP